MDASEVLDVSKNSLKRDSNVIMDISVGVDLITINIKLILPEQNKIHVEKKFKTVNNIDLPIGDVGMVMDSF